MLYFDRIDLYEGADVNKINSSKEYDICYYWYFLNYILFFLKKDFNTIMFLPF